MATMWCQNIATRKQLGFDKVDSRKASESQTFFPQTSTRWRIAGSDEFSATWM